MQQAWLGMLLLLLSSRPWRARTLPRYLITCSITTTDGQHDRTMGPGGVGPKLTVPAYGLLSSWLLPGWSGRLGFSNCKQEHHCKQSWKQYAAVERKQELLWRWHGLKASMKQY
jgi:hypothetical protein